MADSDFTKVLLIGTVPSPIEYVSVFCKVQYLDGDLSISGIVGPTRGGNAIGGCGQIDMEFAHRNPADNDKRYSSPIPPAAIRFADGWNVGLWLTFLDIWKQYHLNDLRPGCEHQEAAGWGKDEIELVTYRLTSITLRERNSLKRQNEARLQNGEAVSLTEDEIAFLSLPWERHDSPDSDSVGSGCYEAVKHETKTSGWVYPKDHPAGVLTKPCTVCGYRYGTEWKRADVPQDILAFLRNLPSASQQPAWI